MAMIDDLATHLEFVGYSVEKRADDILGAKHDSKPNFSMKLGSGKTLLRSFYGGSDFAKANTSEFLEFINGMNEKAMLCRFYSDSDGDLAIEALYMGDYDKQRFAALLSEFENDMMRLASNDDAGRFLN